MCKKVIVFLADGFEEVEGLTVVDLLRRAGVQVTTVSIGDTLTVQGAHGIKVEADALFQDADVAGQDMLVLPGGMPGTTNLAAHKGVTGAVEHFERTGKYIAAICAAPTVFGELGLLRGRTAVCYPGMEAKLMGASVGDTPVSVSEHVVTSRGVGTAIPFAVKLAELLVGKEKAEQVARAIVYQ